MKLLKEKYKKMFKKNNELINTEYKEIYIDVNKNNNSGGEEDFLDDTSSKTLLINISNKKYKQIKRNNNKKRKKDEFYNLKNTDNNIIQLINVKKDYLVSKKQISKVLFNINLEIKKGDFVVLFGKSGSGKSTLLNIISGLDRPTEGHVIVENNNLPYLSNSELTEFRKNYIAFIFQQYHLLNNVTGYENVETGYILQKDKSKSLDIKQLFENFDLLDVMNKYPSQMSGGQQQRVSILRALAKNADIIFADEPTGALDKKTSNIVMELLKQINEEQNKTIIMVSHDPDVVKYAKRKIFLNKGKIILDERIRE